MMEKRGVVKRINTQVLGGLEMIKKKGVVTRRNNKVLGALEMMEYRGVKIIDKQVLGGLGIMCDEGCLAVAMIVVFLFLVYFHLFTLEIL